MPPTIKTRLLSSARVQTSAKTRRNNFATSDARYTPDTSCTLPASAIRDNKSAFLPAAGETSLSTAFLPRFGPNDENTHGCPLSPRCQLPLPFARNTINDGLTYLLPRVCRASEFPRKSSSVELCQGGCAASFVRLPRDTSGFVVTFCWCDEETSEKLTFEFGFDDSFGVIQFLRDMLVENKFVVDVKLWKKNEKRIWKIFKRSAHQLSIRRVYL